MNKVIAGLYENKPIKIFNDGDIGIIISEERVSFGRWDTSFADISKNHISKYEIISKETNKSSSSTYKKSILGSLFFGNAGAVAGAMSADNESVYTIALYWKSGNKSLIEVDEKTYKSIRIKLF